MPPREPEQPAPPRIYSGVGGRDSPSWEWPGSAAWFPGWTSLRTRQAGHLAPRVSALQLVARDASGGPFHDGRHGNNACKFSPPVSGSFFAGNLMIGPEHSATRVPNQRTGPWSAPTQRTTFHWVVRLIPFLGRATSPAGLQAN